MSERESIYREKKADEHRQFLEESHIYKQLTQSMSAKDKENLDNLIFGALSKGFDNGLAYVDRKTWLK